MVGGEGREGEVDCIYLSSSMRWALYVSLLYRCIKWRDALRIIGNIGHIYYKEQTEETFEKLAFML